MKLLTICVPTYKRSEKLKVCVDSIISEINNNKLSEQVNVYVVDDSSPDNTSSVIRSYHDVDFFKGVTRPKNLGMSANIMHMLSEASLESEYQLIITDDDHIEINSLQKIVSFLESYRKNNLPPIIWTPRYSYTEDGALYGVMCESFSISKKVKPSVVSAGRHMASSFVLSGLIVDGRAIDYDLWRSNKENAFFPMIFAGDLLMRLGGYYWNEKIVHHTVLNQCHWDRWGQNDIEIDLRLFTDYVNSYYAVAESINLPLKRMLFYVSSLGSLYRALKGPFLTEKTGEDISLARDAISRLRKQGLFKFSNSTKYLLKIAMRFAVLVTHMKLLALNLFNFLFKLMNFGSSCSKRILWNQRWLKVAPEIMKLILQEDNY